MEANVRDINLAYEETGQGVPVILLHGFPLDHRMWRNQVKTLQADYRVITSSCR